MSEEGHPVFSSSRLLPLRLLSPRLTDLQYAIVRVLWSRGATSVVDVQEALLPERSLAQTTVATLLSRLEKRGVVSHRLVGRQFHYQAEVSEPAVRREMVGELTEMLFDGRPTALISHLLSEQAIPPGELDEVKRLLAAAEARDVGLADSHGDARTDLRADARSQVNVERDATANGR